MFVNTVEICGFCEEIDNTLLNGNGECESWELVLMGLTC